MGQISWSWTSLHLFISFLPFLGEGVIQWSQCLLVLVLAQVSRLLYPSLGHNKGFNLMPRIVCDWSEWMISWRILLILTIDAPLPRLIKPPVFLAFSLDISFLWNLYIFDLELFLTVDIIGMIGHTFFGGRGLQSVFSGWTSEFQAMRYIWMIELVVQMCELAMKSLRHKISITNDGNSNSNMQYKIFSIYSLSCSPTQSSYLLSPTSSKELASPPYPRSFDESPQPTSQNLPSPLYLSWHWLR